MERSIKQIWSLFKKDLLLEVRQQFSFYGILLYVASTIFVLYMAMDAPESQVWNGLFWIIQLFICINAVAKSFFAGKPWAHVVLSVDNESAAFYLVKTLVQFTAYACDE